MFSTLRTTLTPKEINSEVKKYAQEYHRLREAFATAFSAAAWNRIIDDAHSVGNLLGEIDVLEADLAFIDKQLKKHKMINKKFDLLNIKIKILYSRFHVAIKSNENDDGKGHTKIAVCHAYNAIEELRFKKFDDLSFEKDILFQKEIEFAFDVLRCHHGLDEVVKDAYNRETYHKLAFVLSQKCTLNNMVKLELTFPYFLDVLYAKNGNESNKKIMILLFKQIYQAIMVDLNKLEKLDLQAILDFSIAKMYYSRFNGYSHSTSLWGKNKSAIISISMDEIRKNFSDKKVNNYLEFSINDRKNYNEPGILTLVKANLEEFKEKALLVNLFFSVASRWYEYLEFQLKLYQRFLILDLEPATVQRVTNEVINLKTLAKNLFQIYDNFIKLSPVAKSITSFHIPNIEKQEWMVKLMEYIELAKKEMQTKAEKANLEIIELARKEQIKNLQAKLSKLDENQAPQNLDAKPISSEESDEELLEEVVNEGLNINPYTQSQLLFFKKLTDLKNEADEIKMNCILSIKSIMQTFAARCNEPFSNETISALREAMTDCLKNQNKLLRIYATHIGFSKSIGLKVDDSNQDGIEVDRHNIENMIKEVRKKIEKVKQQYISLCERIKRDRNEKFYEWGVSYIAKNKMNIKDYSREEIIQFGKDVFIKKGKENREHEHSDSPHSEERKFLLENMSNFFLNAESNMALIPETSILPNSIFKSENDSKTQLAVFEAKKIRQS